MHPLPSPSAWPVPLVGELANWQGFRTWISRLVIFYLRAKFSFLRGFLFSGVGAWSFSLRWFPSIRRLFTPKIVPRATRWLILFRGLTGPLRFAHCLPESKLEAIGYSGTVLIDGFALLICVRKAVCLETPVAGLLTCVLYILVSLSVTSCTFGSVLLFVSGRFVVREASCESWVVSTCLSKLSLCSILLFEGSDFVSLMHCELFEPLVHSPLPRPDLKNFPTASPELGVDPQKPRDLSRDHRSGPDANNPPKFTDNPLVTLFLLHFC